MEIIIDPQLPYASSVSKLFKPGNRLKISGAKSPATQGFTVYLQCTDTIPIDIALQVKVNLAESTVSLNSQLRSLWNGVHNIHNPQLQCAEKFELTILCGSTQYKIFMNDRNICEYPQRISYKRITDLVVEGDATLERIAYEVAPVAVSYPANRLLTHRIGLTHTDKPPSYSDVKSQSHHQNVNYGAHSIPSAPSYSDVESQSQPQNMNYGAQSIPSAPPYSDVQSQSYPQNVNYGAHSTPSAPYPTETTWPLPMPSQSFSVQETRAKTIGRTAPATAAASSNFLPGRRKELRWSISQFGLLFLVLLAFTYAIYLGTKKEVDYSKVRYRG